MKKPLCVVAIAFGISSAFAGDACTIKVKNAASYAYAQSLGVLVQEVAPVGPTYGNGNGNSMLWSLTIGLTGNDSIGTRTYSVITKSEGSADCFISSVR
jgi:hypothetical protein